MSRFPTFTTVPSRRGVRGWNAEQIAQDYASITGQDFFSGEPVEPRSMSIQYVLHSLENEFGWQFPSMDFLFTQRVKEQRIVTSIIRGLPHARMSLVENSETVVRFEVTVAMPPHAVPQSPVVKGWDAVGYDITKRKVKNSYFTYCFLAIPGVYEITKYEYGFQILATSGIEMFAIVCKYWDNSSVGEVMSRTGQPLLLPLADEQKYPPTRVWRNTSEEFIKKHGNIAFPIGQANKELIIED